MARILVVSSSVPSSAGSGSETRDFYLSKELAREHAVTLLMPLYTENDLLRAHELSCFCDIETYHAPQPANTLLRRLDWSFQHRIPVRRLSRRLIGPPLLTQELQPIVPIIRHQLLRLQSLDFDLMHISQSQLAAALVKVPKPVPLVVDWHNVFSQYYQRLARHTDNIAARIGHKIEESRTRHYEYRVLQSSQSALAVSAIDASYLRKLSRSVNITLIPNGVDCTYFCNQTSPEIEENCIVFTGTMDYQPNIEGVTFFCAQVLPILIRSIPTIRLIIVGTRPTEQVKQLEHRYPANVSVTGTVPDVRPYLQRAALCVVPLLNGGGTRLKILEAMAMQKAVVSTSVGTEGLDTTNSLNILIADSPETFAESVLLLLTNTQLRDRIAEQGRLLVEGRYDWKQIGYKLSQTYQDTINQNRALTDGKKHFSK